MGQMAMSNAYFASRAGERQREEAGPQPFAVPDELAGGGTQDLFFVAAADRPAARPRAAVPIFDASGTRRPRVHVGGRGGHAAPSRRPARDLSPLRISAERVWHEIELVNGTDSPWTTGAALLVQDGAPSPRSC